MTLQGHIQEHLGFMAEAMAQQEIMEQLSPEEQMQIQSSQEGMMAMQAEVASRAAELVGELSEQYAQAVTPPQQTDPLVAIRQQELALREAYIQRRAKEADDRNQLDREKEMNDQMEAAARINIQKEALDEKTRVAEERIQTQRDIAALNNMTKGQ
jgi:phytoene dehydrogenase-like protein